MKLFEFRLSSSDLHGAPKMEGYLHKHARQSIERSSLDGLNAVSSQDASQRGGGGSKSAGGAGAGGGRAAQQLRHNSPRTYSQTIAIIINRYV